MFNFVVSGPKFTGLFSPTQKESFLIATLSDFRLVDPFCRYLRSNLKLSEKFCTFLAPKNFLKRVPELWDLDNYKTQPTFDHVAKFHGDRPRELGDLALEKKQQ